MRQLLNDQFNDEEIDLLIEHWNETTGDIDSEMERIYKELIFLGFSVSGMDEESKDVIKLNLRICIRYNEIKENYLRIKNLIELKENIEKPGISKLVIEKDFLQKIIINLN